jgi:signal transduction histidine kinase
LDSSFAGKGKPFGDVMKKNGKTKQQLLLEMEELRTRLDDSEQAEETFKKAQNYAGSIVETIRQPLLVLTSDLKVISANRPFYQTFKVHPGETEGKFLYDIGNRQWDIPALRKLLEEMIPKNTDFNDFEVDHEFPVIGRRTMLLNARRIYLEGQGIDRVLLAIEDITEHKAIQKRIDATNALLNMFIKKFSRKEYLDGVVELIHDWSRCRCVGIRVLSERGFIPYESYMGFSKDFWESENWLSVTHDQCACIRVVTGKPDPQDRPVMTPAGSFQCNNTITFVGKLTEEEQARFRGVCVENGFLSVAVIPIQYRGKVLGAIHLADEREGMVPLMTVEFIESMAPLIGEAVNRFNLEEQIRDSEKQLKRLSSQLLIAQEHERKRIAREIHDGLGQSLSAIKFRVESVLQEISKSGDKRAVTLEGIVPIIQESIEEARRIQMDLRPSTLDDLGILATLTWFCREFRSTYSGIRIERKIDIQEGEVSDSLKTVIYRISQEALNNIAKHSQADIVHLSLRRVEGRIELAIQDNGQGFDLEKVPSRESFKKGFGLISMKERAILSGGAFTIESVKGEGTAIRASWPIEQS